MVRRGLLFVVSGPSGVGKTTLVERLVEGVSDLVMSRSYTSRPMRPGERQGVDYNFVSGGEFEAMVGRKEFLEWTDIFDHSYGTSAPDTERYLNDGWDLVLVIDIHGARQVRALRPDTTAVFVLPPSFQALERRLRGRSKDSEEQIRHRLDVARDEVGAFTAYDYVVVNDNFEACVDRMRSIVKAERARLGAAQPEAERVIETFGPALARRADSSSGARRTVRDKRG